MDEQIYLLLIIIFVIVVLSRFIVRMINMDNPKYNIPIFYGRILLGFLIAMFFYIIYSMLKGEGIITKFMG